MNLYTSEIEGSFELNLRDYVYDPAGLEFVIPDTCYEVDDFDYWLNVKVENDKLKVEYKFDEYNMGWGYNDEYKFDISFKARNSYQYEYKVLFTLHYIDPTNITDEKGSESETLIIYNLNGQRLPQKKSELMPGVYIVNGKKKYWCPIKFF